MQHLGRYPAEGIPPNALSRTGLVRKFLRIVSLEKPELFKMTGISIAYKNFKFINLKEIHHEKIFCIARNDGCGCWRTGC
jgi:hypothetical protein